MPNALIEWAFHQPTVSRVTAECLPDNAPSIRVLEKIGMERVSESQTMIYWEINNPW